MSLLLLLVLGLYENLRMNGMGVLIIVSGVPVYLLFVKEDSFKTLKQLSGICVTLFYGFIYLKGFQHHNTDIYHTILKGWQSSRITVTTCRFILENNLTHLNNNLIN